MFKVHATRHLKDKHYAVFFLYKTISLPSNRIQAECRLDAHLRKRMIHDSNFKDDCSASSQEK